MLLESARDRVYASGYVFKKGKPRSKRLNPGIEGRPPKRKSTGSTVETESVSLRKGSRSNVECASDMMNYKECDRLTEHMSDLKAEKRQLERELSALLTKDKKSQSYYKSKECWNPLVCGSPEAVTSVNNSEFASNIMQVVTSPISGSQLLYHPISEKHAVDASQYTVRH